MLPVTLRPLSDEEEGSSERIIEKRDREKEYCRDRASQEVERRRDYAHSDLSKGGAVGPHLLEDCADAERVPDRVPDKQIPPLPTSHVKLPHAVQLNEKQSIDVLFFPFFKVHPEMWDKFNRDYDKYKMEILRTYVQWANVIRQLSKAAKQSSASAQAKEEHVGIGSTNKPPLEVELSPSMWDGGRSLQWLEAYKRDLMIQTGEKEPKRQKLDVTATGE